ncbi:MAG: hypothetical protein KME16_22360 [Scytolyngbya sp. HA4215-MV1]|nr:hypothetical protein [Scytolyngbya sp. HA4215-MV1]
MLKTLHLHQVVFPPNPPSPNRIDQHEVVTQINNAPYACDNAGFNWSVPHEPHTRWFILRNKAQLSQLAGCARF